MNKNWQLTIPEGNSEKLIRQADKITNRIFRINAGGKNVFLLLADGMDIIKPEKILPLLYAPEIREYHDRRYIILNRHEHIDKIFFEEKLSILLKVRAMENFCAVVLESDDINKCYQCGKNRTAQVVKADNGVFRIDLDRASGPEAIWKNKPGMMKAAWRKNFEWLIRYAVEISKADAAPEIYGKANVMRASIE